MSAEEWSTQALQAFDAVVRAGGGLRVRGGQRGMAQCVAETFARAQLGKVEDGATPQRAIAVVQAGTGVGKSLAYCAPAIAIALSRGTRVVISTATVALQEQLVHKDLPLLAAQMPDPFRFALAKGRGRYVCKLKLERLAGAGAAGPTTTCSRKTKRPPPARCTKPACASTRAWRTHWPAAPGTATATA